MADDSNAQMSAPGHTHENKGDRGTFGETVSNSLKTQGVQNMEAAWSRAGASAHHTPGTATKLGSQDQIGGSETAGHKTPGTAQHTSGADKQKEPSAIGNALSNLINGAGDQPKK